MKNKALFCLLCCLCLFLFSCEEEQEVELGPMPEEASGMESFGVSYVFSDSAYLRAKMTTPHVVERVETPDSTQKNPRPQAESVHYFSQGVKIEFFRQPNDQLESIVTADSGKFHQRQGLAELNGNVLVKNIRDEQLETEQLFWNQEIDSVYSRTKVKITTPDKVIIGNKGMKSNTAFTNYSIYGIQGEMEVEGEM